MGPDVVDSGYSETLYVLDLGAYFLGYYLSQIGWVPDELGNLNPTYDIKIAKSSNLLEWRKIGKTAIPLQSGEAGVSAVSVLRVGGILHMWFSVRGASNFRIASEQAYKIGYAYSYDRVSWTRSNRFCIEADKSLVGQDEMVCYPSVFRHRGSIFMLYNGNQFGKTGIFLASLAEETLSNAYAEN